jgi:NADPH2:quinone reductase
MRAIQIEAFGGPEVLKLVELPKPEPQEGEVLIRVSRAGMNFADTHQRHDQYVAAQQLPMVPGAEVAGTREDTGERVVALTGHGGYAEYALAPAAHTWPIPEGVDDGTALALLLQGLTAYHLYKTAARVEPGESVVVHSAAGGLGSLTVQLARPLARAGRVIATASTEERRALARELGADVAIDGSPEGLTERLVEANGGKQVDVVFDVSGGEVFERSLRALAPFGRIVVAGISSREQNQIRSGHLLRNSRTAAGFWVYHCLDRPAEMVEPALAELFALARQGRLKVVVGGTYPLADAARAQEDLAGRRTHGKLLLDPTIGQ